ncbi:MAG: hypothetical protein HC902_03675 [Calothrix sp. SM1_5_4]|nr:hypothetical protein [Calothrix sp. SM1_5_4]
MPEVRRWREPKKAKIFLGYSDITTLHGFLNQSWKWPSLHGPLLERLGRGVMSRAEKGALLGLLRGELRQVEFNRLKALNPAARAAAVIRGPVLGGNMAVLQSGLGTPSALRPKGSVLFSRISASARIGWIVC